MKRRSSRYARKRRPAVKWREVGRQVFWAGCLTVIVGALSGGIWFTWRQVLESGAIDLREIEVFGARRVGSELGQYLQLGHGTPLSRIDTDVVRMRLEKHPWVRSAEVEKHFPHRLTLRIVEREPALLHLTRRLYVVDTEGVWVKAWEPDDAIDLPVVTGVQPVPVTEATGVLRDLASFVEYWDAPTSPVRVGEVHYAGAGEVWVYPMDHGPLLHLPLDAGLWPQARARLGRVLEEARRIGLELQVIDLLYPDRAVARRKT